MQNGQLGAGQQPEIALTGGNTSVVLRVGSSVRRSVGAWSPAVHQLLAHLERVGFDGAPRFLGIDEHGREVLTFLPGDVATGSPWPARFWSEVVLRQVGELLARYHHAVRDYRPSPDSIWWSGVGGAGDGELMCHNDAAPYNTVLGADGHLVGFIDWDVAGPARPGWDVAFALWSWVPLHHPELRDRLGGPGEGTQARRVQILCGGYGIPDPVEMLPLIRQRVLASRDGLRNGAERHDPISVRLCEEGHLDDMNRTLTYLDARLPELSDELGRRPDDRP